MARERRELSVRDELAVGHLAQRVRDGALKRRAPFEVERDVTQLDALAGEIRLKPRDELRHEVVTVRRLFPGYADSWDLASPQRGAARRRAGPRELVPDEDVVLEPEFPYSPALRVVEHLSFSNIHHVSSHAIFRPPTPTNEPIRDYAPGSPEREELQRRLKQMASERIELPCIIGGGDVFTGDTAPTVMPHRKDHVLADVHQGGPAEVERAIKASAEAWNDWSRTPWEDRAAVLLRAAELLAGPWRATLNAATMLNQSKTAHQAEIDAACELIDLWRFNVEFMTRIY
jgi:hypothetical protein